MCSPASRDMPVLEWGVPEHPPAGTCSFWCGLAHQSATRPPYRDWRGDFSGVRPAGKQERAMCGASNEDTGDSVRAPVSALNDRAVH